MPNLSGYVWLLLALRVGIRPLGSNRIMLKRFLPFLTTPHTRPRTSQPKLDLNLTVLDQNGYGVLTVRNVV